MIEPLLRAWVFVWPYIWTLLVGLLSFGVLTILWGIWFWAIQEIRTEADCLAWGLVYLFFIYLIGGVVRAALNI